MWGWIGWTLFVLLFVWYVASMWNMAGRNNHLISYVVFLLLSDDIRADHKEKFKDWISKSDETRADHLAGRANVVLRRMADSLAIKGSALSASAFIWGYKTDALRTGPVSLDRGA